MAVNYRYRFFSILLLTILTGKLLADPIVAVATGDVRGTEMTSTMKDRTFYAFRGIPYGKAPVGDLRFQPPLPADSWSGVFNATQDGETCIQMSGSNIVGSEDCLFIYVYTPQLPSNGTSQLPVMAFIHGGGFSSGSPQYSSFGPERLMDYDVVLVLFGYRLGPLGFLSTGDDASMGNYGLLDQVLALQWIQTNVGSFGGDKDKVTIFGESAGGASVTYHLISEASAGLFHGVIAESGSPMCPWAFQSHPRFWAEQLAITIQCPYNSSSDLVDCLTQKPVDDIIVAYNAINGYSLLELPFVPSKEDPVNGRFLKQDPAVILSQGTFNKVPIISGINKDEGDSTYSMTTQYYTTIDENFYDNILPYLIHNLTKYDANLVNVSYAVKEEYFDKIDVNNQTQVIRTAIDFNSDPFFKAATDYTIRKVAQQLVPAYMYSFEYTGSCSSNRFSGEPEVSHGDEICYLFYQSWVNFTPEDQYISDQLLSMWVNFATYLNPTPSSFLWTPTPPQENVDYLEISANELAMQRGYLTERMLFWENRVPLIVAGVGV